MISDKQRHARKQDALRVNFWSFLRPLGLARQTSEDEPNNRYCMPPASVCVHDSMVQLMRSKVGKWMKTRAALTESSLFLSKSSDQTLAIHCIPLHEITKIARPLEPAASRYVQERDRHGLTWALGPLGYTWKRRSGLSIRLSVNSVIPEVETAPSPRAVAHLGTSKKNLQLDYEIDEDSEPDESKPENTCLLQINTAAEGFNFGRIYTLRFNDEIEIETWKEALLALSASDKLSYNRRTYISRQQQKIREFYDCKTVQYSAAFLIIVNFFIEAVSLQFNFAKDSSQAQILDNIDTLFTVVFLLELLVNMAGVCVHACVRVYSLSLTDCV